MTPTQDALTAPLLSAATANTAAFRSETASPFSSLLPENSRLRMALPWIAAYTLVSYLTGAFFMADTVDYVADVYSHYVGVGNTLWEFGHLIWRPLGWLLIRTLAPVIAVFAGPDLQIQITYIFVALNWVAGLASVLLLRAFLRRFSIRPAVADLCTFAFLCSNAFLNYIHAGSSYIPGLAFLLLGFYLLSVPAEREAAPSPWRPVWAAAALALAVFLWIPYIFAVPGALATPLFHRNEKQSSWALTWRATIYCLMLGIVSYGLVLVWLRILTPDGVFRWVTAEAAAIGGTSGSTRAIFGLARSFINMGDDGVLFKRFLLHDPYNPVSFFELVRASLLKLFLFYAFLLTGLMQLLRAANRSTLWLCLMVATPVFVFAVFWFGGDMERYLPLYPVLFLAVGCALSDHRAPSYLKWFAAAVLLVGVASNFGAASNFALRIEQRPVEQRMKDVLPLLNPSSLVVLLDIHDELVDFERAFPFHPIVRNRMVETYPVLNIGTPKDLRWHQDLAQTVLNTWSSDGDIWISKRVLELRPHRDWIWVEGADPKVTWPMIRSFFTEFEYGRSAGGDDGFLLLVPTDKNKAIVNSIQAAYAALKH